MAASTKWGWSLNNLINPEIAMPRGFRLIAFFSIAAALFLHGLLIWGLSQQTVVVRVRPPIAVELVRVHALPVEKPVVHAPPPPPVVIHIKPKVIVPHIIPRHISPPVPRYSPPVTHFSPANQDDGLGLGLPQPNAGTGQGSMDGFDAAVHQKVEAAKTYPPGTPGLWNECVVNYRLTVDHSGQLLRYKLFGCGNPFLDAAARAAILLSTPLPLPPDFGGSEYTVFGSLIYKQQ